MKKRQNKTFQTFEKGKRLKTKYIEKAALF